MKTVVVDCRGVADRETFWDLYVQVVRPRAADLFGRNLDAFWDALHGGPGMPDADEVRFSNSAELARIDGGVFLEALRHIAREFNGPPKIDFQ